MTAELRPENIPSSLKWLTQWCCWRYGPERANGKRPKIPCQPDGKPAKSNDGGATWHTFAACLQAYQSGKFAGVGIFLSGNLTGVDLDGCRDADGANENAAEILGRFAGTYAEVSPSGTGYRVLCLGKPQRSGKNSGKSKWVEVYAEPSSRFLTVTGNTVGCADVTEQQAALDWLHARYFDGKPDGNDTSGDTTTVVNIASESHDVYIGRPAGNTYRGIPLNNPYRGLFGNPYRSPQDGTRAEVIAKFETWLLHDPEAAEQRRLLPELRGKRLGCHCAPLACHGDVLARLANATASDEPTPPPPHTVFTVLSDGELIEKANRNPDFAALWRGDTSGHGGDASSADMALCGALAWWTNGDAAQMDRLFRQSGLFRDKWDSRRGDTTYGMQTMALAISNCRGGYTGKDRHSGGAAGGDFDEVLLASCGIGLKPEPDGQAGQSRTNQDTPRKSLFVDAATLTANPQPPDWLIRNWIVRDSLTTVFGDPGGGKSLLALDWACCVATGRNWNGCRVKTGAVLYIAGEGYAGIARRLAAWQLENEPLPPGRLFISERPVLLNAAGAAAVLEEVTALSEPPALVEVDTLARSIDGNENDAGDMGGFIRAVDMIRVNTRCALVVLHHCGAADKNRARGHTSLKGAVDAEVCVEKAGQPGQTGMSGIVRCTKAKDSEPPEPLAFEIHGVTLPKDWWDAEEPDKPVTGATLHVTGELSRDPVRSKLPATSTIALAALRDALIQHGAEMAGVVAVSLEQWRDAAYGRGISDSELPDTRRKAFERARKDLLVRGAVVCADERYWIPVPRTDRTNRT